MLLLSVTNCKSDKKPVTNWKRTSNELVIRLAAEPGGLNPVLSLTDQYATQVMRHLFLYLMTIDPQTGQLEPSLVIAAPKIDPITEGPWAGGLRYSFEIRPEAHWDNGTPITGNDYVFALKAALNPKVPAQRIRPYLGMIKDVEVNAANPKKFSVLTNETYILALEAVVSTIPLFPAYNYDPEGQMAEISLADLIDPAKANALESDPRVQAFADRFTSERYSRDPSSVLGSGAYLLESIGEDQRFTLVKKQDWWGEKISNPPSSLQAYPDKLIYWPVRDQAAAVSLVKSEELDIAVGIDSKDFVDLKTLPGVTDNYQFFTPATYAYYFIYVNTKNPKLSDKRVRQALAHLLNVEEIIETVFYGLGERVNGPVLPMKDYYNKDLPLIPYNVERAKILLSEAGWIDSNNNGTADNMVNGERIELKLTYLITNVPAQEKIAAIFKDAATQAGIDLEIISKEFQAQRADLNTRNYELASGALIAPPVLDDFYQVWHTDSDTPDGTNRTSFGNAQSDELIERIRQTLDKKERDQLYKTFQKMVYEEQPMLFLLTPQSRILVHKRFDAFASPLNPGFFPNQYQLLESLR
ncbi:MAG: hypothetical protein IPJ40_01880 [Saprospirales bacterium]|nr:hypothetical protein [Saprospirales bacterium]